ncbi:MAG TPA: N-6 DNA methylase [Acidimicrobiales bacterium]
MALRDVPLHLDGAARRRLGAWYTPPWLVEGVLDLTLDPVLAARASPTGLRILDPACGDGRFLVAAAERLAHRFGGTASDHARRVHGVDLDAQALAAARAVLGPGAVLRQADALTDPWSEAPFDVVVGNPPFLSQLASATARGGASAIGGGPYADTAALFLALATRLVRPGGRVALVLPQSVLSTRDASSLRAEVAARGAVEALWLAGEAVFDAAVHTCVIVVAVGAHQGPVRRYLGPSFAPLAEATAGAVAGPTWGPLAAPVIGVPEVKPETSGVLGDIAGATAGFRDQFYGLAPFVREGGAGAPLVTCGHIDVGRCRWGDRPVRFARHVHIEPVVDLDALGATGGRVARWVQDRLRPKVVLATQTRVLEAAADIDGRWVPSVPVVSIEPYDPGAVWRVAAVLTSGVASAWAAATYAGAGLSGAAIKLSAAQVRTLPLPARPWDAGVAALRDGDVAACANAVDSAYGVDDPTLRAWWRAGAASAGSSAR